VSYKNKRGIRFSTIPRSRDRLWSNPLVESYHNILLFARQLGFDILTFKPLEDSIFEIVTTTAGTRTSYYRRHHLDPSKKMSMFLQDLLLTDVRTHNYYERLGTAKTMALMNAFSELVMKEGNINENDIITIFTKYGIKEDVYDNWYLKNAELSDYITEFNNRKENFKQKGLEYFIEEFNKNGEYQALYSRFYTQFKNDDLKRIMLFITNPASRDYSDWIAMDYYFSKNPDVMNYFAYNPQIFKYWFGD